MQVFTDIGSSLAHLIITLQFILKETLTNDCLLDVYIDILKQSESLFELVQLYS